MRKNEEGADEGTEVILRAVLVACDASGEVGCDITDCCCLPALTLDAVFWSNDSSSDSKDMFEVGLRVVSIAEEAVSFEGVEAMLFVLPLIICCGSDLF